MAGLGLVCFPASLVWLSRVMAPDTPIWQLMLPIALLGVANAFMWAPIGSTATRILPPAASGQQAEGAVGHLPPALHQPYAEAMAQSMLLPAGVLLIGLVAVLCFARPGHLNREPDPTNHDQAMRKA